MHHQARITTLASHVVKTITPQHSFNGTSVDSQQNKHRCNHTAAAHNNSPQHGSTQQLTTVGKHKPEKKRSSAPLQQGVALPPPTIRQDNKMGKTHNTSVNTGEGSAAAQPQQPQQQYMQQPGVYGTPHGAYHGYNPYEMQGRGMYPPGNHPQMHPGQMQVLPPGGPYAPRGMYPPRQHMKQHNMMRGPPQPYYGGGPAYGGRVSFIRKRPPIPVSIDDLDACQRKLL